MLCEQASTKPEHKQMQAWTDDGDLLINNETDAYVIEITVDV